MRSIRTLSIILALGLLCACAGANGTPVDLRPGETAVTIEADSFHFKPSQIRAVQGTRLQILLKNVAGIAHNLTIQNPDGETLVNQDVAAGATERLTVDLEQAGTYKLLCDKPLHPSLGMKGEILVARR